MISFCFLFYPFSLLPSTGFHYWLPTVCARKGLKHSAGFPVTFMPFDPGLMALSFYSALIEYGQI